MVEKKWKKAYTRELGGSFVVYAFLLVLSIRYGRGIDNEALRPIVLISPMIGFGLAIWAIARHVQRIDEFLRLRVLESLSIAAAVTAALTFSYGFLETAGYPRMSMFAVWPIMGAAWLVVALARGRAQR
jgi:hypothetical protein